MARTTKSAAPVLKKQSPTLKKIGQTERRKLMRAAANAEKDRQEYIREEMRKAEKRSLSQDDIALRNRVAKGLGNVLRLVANSYPEWNRTVGFNVSLHESSYGGLQAYTDFKKISVTFPVKKFVMESDGSMDNEITRTTVRQFLGVGYHEVGHVLYSKPFPELKMESTYHRCWNALEDQRMELAVTDASPDIAGYFTAMFLQNFLEGDLDDAWWLAVGRLYLPTDVRASLKDLFVSKYGSAVEESLRTIVRNYSTATTDDGLKSAIVAYYELFRSTRHEDDGQKGPSDPSHRDATTGSHEKWVNSEGMFEKKADQSKDASKGASSGERFDDAEANEQGSTDNSGQDSDEPSDAEESASGSNAENTSGGQGAGLGGDPDDNSDTSKKKVARDLLESVRDRIAKAMDTDSRVDDALRTVADTEAANYLEYISGSAFELDTEEMARASRITAELERALEVANAYNRPAWRRRQERGVVDPLIYRTRRSGDNEFRRQRVGDGSTGYDVAVSLVLDVSGSMEPEAHDLSIAAYAVKQACWSLDIPCTITAFSGRSRLVSDAIDAPEPIGLGCGGGTRPSAALAEAANQHHDRESHLVLLLTDGQCSDGEDEIRALQTNGSYVLGVGLGGAWSRECLVEMGLDESQAIETCDELPVLVENWLSRTIATGR